MFLTTTWFGCFLFDNGQVVDHRLFPADPQDIAVRYERIRNGEVLEEERELAGHVADLVVEDIRLLSLGNAIICEQTDDDSNTHQRNQPDPKAYSISQDILREALILVATRKLKLAFAAREIIELIAAMDDLNKSINLLHEREAEWKKVYGDEESPSVFHAFMKRIQGLEDLREELQHSIELLMEQESPSLSHLVGELLGARLIALAGGKERLARLPAGTIQILGAENAFFRFRRSGKGMPKHGVIFQHPWIRNARKDQRGRIARTLAGKIALAARIDHYSGRNDGAILRSAVEKRIEDLKGKGKRTLRDGSG